MDIDNLQYIKTAVKCDNKLGLDRSSLGIYYEIKFHNKKLLDYIRQDVLAEILPKERVNFCMRSVVPGRSGVKLLHNKEFMKAHYGNLMVCGSIWLCPVCASKISERRKEELKKGFGNYKGGFIMVTYTLKHKRGESLKDILSKLDRAYSLVTHGRYWQEFKKNYKVLGSVSNLEITYGSNGWHPHKHVVYLVDNESVFEEFKKDLNNRYLSALVCSGASGLDGIAVKFDLVTDYKGKVAEYVAQYNKDPKKESWAIEAELTKSYVKSSKNFWSILDDFISFGEYKDLVLLREYAEAIKGRRSVVMSRGLKDILKIEDKSDIEIVQEKDQKAELLHVLSREIWDKVKQSKKRGELLKVASKGNLEDVLVFIESLK